MVFQSCAPAYSSYPAKYGEELFLLRIVSNSLRGPNPRGPMHPRPYRCMGVIWSKVKIRRIIKCCGLPPKFEAEWNSAYVSNQTQCASRISVNVKEGEEEDEEMKWLWIYVAEAIERG